MKVLDIIFFLPASPHTKWEVKKTNSQVKFATLFKLARNIVEDHFVFSSKSHLFANKSHNKYCFCFMKEHEHLFNLFLHY